MERRWSGSGAVRTSAAHRDRRAGGELYDIVLVIRVSVFLVLFTFDSSRLRRCVSNQMPCGKRERPRVQIYLPK